ncbi:hypothetical protein Hanom_Chr09g00780661 [Helianthus anomalus]
MHTLIIYMWHLLYINVHILCHYYKNVCICMRIVSNHCTISKAVDQIKKDASCGSAIDQSSRRQNGRI